MSEQADIEAALARATAAYKNVSAERDALKDANDRAEAVEAERDRLREALTDARAIIEVRSLEEHSTSWWAGEVLKRIDATLAKEPGQ